MPTVQQLLDQAWSMHQAGDVRSAEAIYRHVLSQLPNHAAAHVYLGIAHFDQRNFEHSIQSYRKALKQQPHFPIAWNNLGNSLRMIGDLQESDRCLAKAMEQDPKYLSPYKNRGTLWVWAGDIDRGLRWYHEGLKLAPNDTELHRNLGVIYLLQQRYDEGWVEYRHRWSFIGGGRPQYPFPVWQGEEVQGKTILLYPEQGLGDTIQFIREAALLKSQGARVVVVCPPKLVPLLGSVPGIDDLIPEGISLYEPADYQASFIDVVDFWYGKHRQIATCQDVLDLNAGYISVSPQLIDYWKHKLGPRTAAKRIGICWQGNPGHHADIYRSIALKQFAPVVQVPDVSFLSLQHGFGSEQIKNVSFGNSIQQLPEGIDQSGGAFLDTAAIMKNLDLVITTDTSTAHLAGSLGVPVWVILGKVPDWRWLLEGDRTAWYPSMRLFRQQTMGDWTGVMQHVADALKSFDPQAANH